MGLRSVPRHCSFQASYVARAPYGRGSGNDGLPGRVVGGSARVVPGYIVIWVVVWWCLVGSVQSACSLRPRPRLLAPI
eukprot:scaffold10980_cov125-Isochrysis_galbana.AAC.7